MKKVKVAIEFLPMGGFGGGFRTEWVSGTVGDYKFSMDSGAGLGNPLLTFSLKKGEESYRYYTADMRKMVEQLMEQLAGVPVQDKKTTAKKSSRKDGSP